MTIMKMKKIAAACLAIAGMTFVSTFANAAEGDTKTPTNGKIEFTGSLVSSACGLTPESSPVEVNFGEVPTSQLKDGKRAGITHASIELQGCDTTVASAATVKYTPQTLDQADGKLAAFTSGTAKGAGIGLIDSGNQDVVWEQETSKVKITDGKSSIPFVAYIQADSKDTVVTPGEFKSTIDFQIDYQ